LGVQPGEAVYVGDTPLDAQASRAGGLASVAVLSGAGNSAELSAADPDWIIHSHARLPEIVEAA
jgi:phosphoglycolate phosphatase-like HAD superfamily hydrolase